MSTEKEKRELERLTKEYTEGNPEDYSWLKDFEHEDFDFANMETVPVEQLEDSQMNNIKMDPKYSGAETASLKQLEEMSKEGLTLRDEANLEQIQKSGNRNLQGQMGAISQNMQSRGIAGSGLEMMGKQQAAQANAEREAMRGLEVGAQSQERKRGATMDLGQLSGQLSNRDFNRDARTAQAQDVVNRFNTNNTNKERSHVRDSNWEGQNDAAQYNNRGLNRANEGNITGRQGIENKNVSGRNANRDTDYAANMDMGKMNYNAKVDADNKEALRRAAEKKRKRKKKSAVGSAVGGVVGGVAGAYFGGPAGATAGASAGSQLGGAMAAHGGKVSGNASDEDTYQNDTQTINVSAGEVIIPSSIADEPETVRDFVEMLNEQGEAGTIEQRNPSLQVDEPQQVGFSNRPESTSASEFEAAQEGEEEEADIIDNLLETISILTKKRGR
tara:strand:+ start:3158 stop:4489 length:1332 start_codon:yes stop_codon:yes gene_type:complete